MQNTSSSSKIAVWYFERDCMNLRSDRIVDLAIHAQILWAFLSHSLRAKVKTNKVVIASVSIYDFFVTSGYKAMPNSDGFKILQFVEISKKREAAAGAFTSSSPFLA